MEKSTTPTRTALFERWEEVFVSNNKGKREVHYYLKRKDGNSELAVVGKERGLRHMAYYYALRNRSLLLSLFPSNTILKLRSRRDVVDWLSSIVSDPISDGSSQSDDGPLESEYGQESKTQSSKDFHSQRKEFTWLGSAWTCRKRRRHFKSFCRNCITISVHDFVYIMAEENKRLLAYIEDLYEDSRGNKMVVVRWFHKIDEVGIVLPPDFNDREIFFSLCLQDLRVECIDGLATVLSPQHFKKFLNEARHRWFEPFVCHRMVDNDDVKPFDITQIQGYWKQEILRFMYTTAPPRTDLEPLHGGGGLEVDGDEDVARTRPKKRLRTLKCEDVDQQDNKKDFKDLGKGNNKCISYLVSGINGSEMHIPRENGLIAPLSRKEITKEEPHQHLIVGSHVEVLSQDSGLRGCWFRAIVLKRHKDKVKVQYQDIRDAVDENNNLKEWVLGSRIAGPDLFGLRLCGRTTIRPCPPYNKGRVSWGFDVGASVDAWWCDGWWEGIVVRKESEDRVHVYFQGERRTLIFGSGDLRRSQDWVGNRWKCIKERPDIVASILSGLESEQDVGRPNNVLVSDNRQPGNNNHVNTLLQEDDKATCNKTSLGKEPKTSIHKSTSFSEPRDNNQRKEVESVPNLANDGLLAQLKWKSSRKRRRSRESKRYVDGSSSSSQEEGGSPASERFLIPKPLMVDHENCKYRGDSLFNASIPPLSSLVMSR
ncbi:PREDICTED: uncharacterized protein LOC104601746 [Nelumbo nucifera]|uniref:Uncharacterized protein LOC104601746 n=1 Tax=Nelumbo nucifera TaxID=4432 RepID=A0A1U8A849_NELNU|nr:PREDICTED: uncharacterized protein LOC104601746 [Nelumbo nucifera]